VISSLAGKSECVGRKAHSTREVAFGSLAAHDRHIFPIGRGKIADCKIAFDTACSIAQRESGMPCVPENKMRREGERSAANG
jgi:hypothetical protein